MPSDGSRKPLYDCDQCPAYCCTYPSIPVTLRDVRRLAKRFELTLEQAEQRFTKRDKEGARVMRHKVDHIFPSACQFLDQEKRQCTIYEDRPKICREFPTRRCGYYDFMEWERDQQQDDEFIPVVV
jgi:Fe-S-cluster containining protein